MRASRDTTKEKTMKARWIAAAVACIALGIGTVAVGIDATEESKGIVLFNITSDGEKDPHPVTMALQLANHALNDGREAVLLASQWALRNIAFEHLIYPVDRGNAPSRRIPESMGGEIFNEQKVETMRGTELDEVVFKITSEKVAATLDDAG